MGDPLVWGRLPCAPRVPPAGARGTLPIPRGCRWWCAQRRGIQKCLTTIVRKTNLAQTLNVLILPYLHVVLCFYFFMSGYCSLRLLDFLVREAEEHFLI